MGGLGVGPPGIMPGAAGIDMNLLGGDSLANAYLFAVSAVLVQAAAIEAGRGGSADGELQQLLNSIAADMEDGTLEPARAQLLAEAEQALLPDLVVDMLQARFDERLAPHGSRKKAGTPEGVPAVIWSHNFGG